MAAKPFTVAGVTYPSQYAYRISPAYLKGQPTRAARIAFAKAERALQKLTAPQRTARSKALEVVSLVRRDKFSLSEALKVVGTSRETVKKYAPGALEKREGRYVVTSADVIPRKMRFVTEEGIQSGFVGNSGDASTLGRYFAEVKHFKETGDASGLKEFEGKTVTINGQKVKLITDPEALRTLAAAGELEFDDLYDLV
jgi:hypothetical protein